MLEIEIIRKKVVGTLPYGLQKRVELARALAMQPELLLLDEPMAGMNLEEKEDIARFIIDIFEGQGDTYPKTPVLRDGINCIILVGALATSSSNCFSEEGLISCSR